jgi:predicted lipoprotein with Yx(FWY)xxD motif
MNAQFNHKLFKPASLVGLLAIMAMVLAACAPAATATTTPPVTQPVSTPTTTAITTPTIDIANDPTLGQFLTDGTGRTLYVSLKDAPDASACNASCQALWPPLLTLGTPKVGPGVDASLIGFTTLAGGEKIVTYDHRPLYYKATDQKVGEKTGEAVGNVWFVLSPAGSPISATGSVAGTPTPAPTASQPTPTTGAAAPTPAATPIPVTEPTIAVTNNSTLGNILTANNGMTLYAYTMDTPDTSNCNAVCQTVWMPLLTNGNPTLGTGVTASMIGSAKLASGQMVVTYNHMPLYYFVNDTAVGMTSGEGFDNVWFAVSPDGKMVGSVSEVSINLATNSLLGSYLVGQGGQAIYLYTKDTADTSTCAGVCATIWPPVITLGKPNLGSGVDASMIGTIKLANGSLMLTYNHKPLYYFVGDSKATDIKGQGFKNIWYVLGADGNNITTLLPAAPASEPTIDVANNTTYGQILVDGNGMTLYVNVNDTKGESSCDAACLQNWTPLFSLGHPNVGDGVNNFFIGTATTSYGLMVVTYYGHPLYLYKGDMNPGDVNGEDMNVAWYVISEAGQVVARR